MNEQAWLKHQQHEKSPPNPTKSTGIWCLAFFGVFFFFKVYGSLIFLIVSCSEFSLEGAVPRHSEKGYSCSIHSPARSRKLHKSHKKVCFASRADSEVNPSCVIAFNQDPARLNHRIYRNQRAPEGFGRQSGKYLSTKCLSRSQNQIPRAVAQQGQGKHQQCWNPAPDQAQESFRGKAPGIAERNDKLKTWSESHFPEDLFRIDFWVVFFFAGFEKT